MARCEDCIHYEICDMMNVQYGISKIYPSQCSFYKPAASVAPKAEVDRLEYILLGVMHSVDKWLDGDELNQDEVNRAITMREKTLRLLETARAELAREIFGEIAQIKKEYASGDIDGNTLYVMLHLLEKKYTEGHARAAESKSLKTENAFL